MSQLIDNKAQATIAAVIDNAVQAVLANISSHGAEEALTSALGQELAQRTVIANDVQVTFNYRQHGKSTEEPTSGADGSFLVRVKTPVGQIEKAALWRFSRPSFCGAKMTSARSGCALQTRSVCPISHRTC